MSVRLKGVNELKLALRNKADMGAVKQIVKHNGSGLQARAQRNVPVKTGNLKRSIQLEISDGGLLAKSEATAEYAPYVEWGTRYMEAQPYMKPAFNEQKEQFRRDMNRLTK
ncbi:HK97 gp10 family phage protein [Dorea sp. 5-2]|nr:HK97 gp10 family phage protein [Dorea sp. 5-2]